MSGSNDTVEPEVCVVSLVLTNFVPLRRRGEAAAAETAAPRAPAVPPRAPRRPRARGGRGAARGTLSCSQGESPRETRRPGAGSSPRPAGGPSRGRAQGAAGSPRPHLHSAGPTLLPGVPPSPGPAAAWVRASRGSTYFVAGALGFVVAAGRHPLGGWRRHCSPGAGAASPVPQLQHLPLSRGRGGLRRPRNPNCARGSRWRASLHPAAPHSTPSGAAATNTPPPRRRGRRAGSPPKRHQRASARGRGERGRRRGRGLAPERAGRARGARPERRRRRRGGARPPVARCASPRGGPGGETRRGGERKRKRDPI